MNPKNLGMRASVMAVASCLAISAAPLAAHAAGLGKIVVFSGLGQALRAEIEVSATREELSDMKAQLASPDAFKQAGLDYATTLLGIRFSLDKRPNGQSVIKLTSDKPINDPFVDMLLELNWPAGRLVREYTFLLDPPEVAAKAVAPVAAATARPVTPSKQAATGRSSATIDDDTRGKAMAKIPAQGAAQKSADQPLETREVRRGDTLNKIASETKPEGVSLEQMLVGLLRANQEAFDGGNMNRLKAGRILSVPDKSALEAVSPGEARKVVAAQSSDWNAYRSKLAGVAAQAPVKEDAAKQEAAGKITAKVEDKVVPADESKDQLKVSKTDAASAKAAASAAKGVEEDRIAKEKALKEAGERLAVLEKNVADLQKLVELKNQNLAELQKQAAAKPAPVEAKKPVEEVKPTEQPAPAPVVAPAKVEPVAVAPEKPAEPKAVEAPPVKPEEAKPEAKPVAEAKPAEAPKPVSAPPPPPPLPSPEPEGGDGLLDNPLALAGGAGILALIAAYFVARRRRATKGETPLDLNSTLSPQSQSLTANSVFRSTGGQSVDTSHTPAQTDFSQAGPGSIDTDEVDPVAEADVYMAYGRDAQAEEILIEARQKDPKRYAIHLKLLEIYSNRKDVKQFETLATDLYGETSGVGADWEKAAEMGLKLDPENPLFAASAQEAPAAFDADATVIVSSQTIKNTVTLPGELSQLADLASAAEASSTPPAPVAADLTSLDFDLGLDEVAPTAKSETNVEIEDVSEVPAIAVDSGALDFDLATDDTVFSSPAFEADSALADLDFNLPATSPVATADAGATSEVAEIDFDLGFEPTTADIGSEVQSASQGVSNDVANTVLVDDDGVEFDVSLTESTFLGRSMPEASSFDMSSIDLDLQEPELVIPEPANAPLPEPETSIGEAFESLLASTAVNPDFATEQAETMVNPQFGVDQEDLMPEHDFSTVQAETLVNPQFGVEQDLAPAFDISANEEVATKLDLAKAYEEMGDFEGARELLQEVVHEGDAAQKEKAQAILAKIGE